MVRAPQREITSLCFTLPVRPAYFDNDSHATSPKQTHFVSMQLQNPQRFFLSDALSGKLQNYNPGGAPALWSVRMPSVPPSDCSEFMLRLFPPPVLCTWESGTWFVCSCHALAHHEGSVPCGTCNNAKGGEKDVLQITACGKHKVGELIDPIIESVCAMLSSFPGKAGNVGELWAVQLGWWSNFVWSRTGKVKNECNHDDSCPVQYKILLISYLDV